MHRLFVVSQKSITKHYIMLDLKNENWFIFFPEKSVKLTINMKGNPNLCIIIIICE